ncbi:MAG: hypothetical protein ACE5I1_11120 [bacterium]
MTETILKEVAQKFALTEQQVVEEGVKAFLQAQLHYIEIERQQIFAKFGVHSLEDLDSYINIHPDKETDILPELQRADYLTSRKNDLAKLMSELNGND